MKILKLCMYAIIIYFFKSVPIYTFSAVNI